MSSTSTMSESISSWRTDFDPILNQVYYVNSENGAVSFDSPCEVQNTPKRNSGSGFFSRISSKLSLIRSKSSSQNATSCPFSSRAVEIPTRTSTESVNYQIASPTSEKMDRSEKQTAAFQLDSYSLASAPSLLSDSDVIPRNAYLMERAFHIDQYDDMSSIFSDESIQSFHHELPRSEIYYDYEHSIYVDKLSLPHLDFDKEQERYELRQQMLQELY